MEEVISSKNSREGEKTVQKYHCVEVVASGLVWPELMGTIRCPNCRLNGVCFRTCGILHGHLNSWYSLVENYC